AAQAFKFFRDIPIEVGEKTGTAEVEGKNPDGSDYDSYAWMVAFAPYDDPEIAITVFMVQAGTSINCGPVVRDIVCKYFDIKINPDDQSIVVDKNKDNNEKNDQENNQNNVNTQENTNGE
ncbi:MAG: penicillin-binding transpeptidase domain-containing protein, partial [Anaerococcus hydrogenalis]|nr:penicillin-binding transpeptidase domain-containing protein [Anaerococcus hydrogenalis]